MTNLPPAVRRLLPWLLGWWGVQVPAGWHVWWSCRGVGGVGVAEGADVFTTEDERGADLRVHADLLVAGVGLETAPQDDSWGR